MHKHLKMKYWIILPAICLSIVYNSNGQPAKSQPADVIILDHIAMYVYNLEKSTAFYEKILNFKKVPEPFKDGKHTWFDLNATSRLHLIQGAENNIKRDKNDHLCFSVASVINFVNRLKENKIPYSNWTGESGAITTRIDGVKQIYFQDPDGHWIEINDNHGAVQGN